MSKKVPKKKDELTVQTNVRDGENHKEAQKLGNKEYENSGHQGRHCGSAPGIRVPHLPTDARVGPRGQQLRSKTRARTAAPLQHQDYAGHQCPGHYARQAGSAGDVPERIVQGLMGREKPSDELDYLGPTPRFVGILWARANRGISPKCFGMMVARDGIEPPTPAFSV